MSNEFSIKIKLDGASAVSQDLNKVGQSAIKSGRDVSVSLKSATSAFDVFKGAVAAQAVVGAFNSITRAASDLGREAIEASIIQQDAVNKLSTALQVAGTFSQAALKDFQDFASGIQAVTVFGDEAILSQLALAKSFGATNEQAKTIVLAATELSSALGKSLDESTKQVAKTLGGLAGELGEINPAIKELTKEQLRNGEAANILLNQFGGTAQGQIRTYSGSLQQAKNTYGDLLETIGSFITENKAVIGTVNAVSKAITAFNTDLVNSNSSIQTFIQDGIILLSASIGPVIELVDVLSRGIRVLFNSLVSGASVIALAITAPLSLLEQAIISVVSKIPIIGESFKNLEGILTKSTKGLANQILQDSKDIQDALGGGSNLDSIAKRFNKLSVDIQAEIGAVAVAAAGSSSSVERSNERVVNSEKKKLDSLQLLNAAYRQSKEEQQALDSELSQIQNDEFFIFLEENLGREQALRELARAKELQSRSDTNAAIISLEAARVKAQQNQIFTLQQFENLSNRQRLENFKSTLGSISTLTSSSNKTLFAIGKAAAIANATIDGIAATQKALASAPPPFNFALAALVGTASAANIAKIASSKPPAFQNGGIVQGNTRTGDQVISRLNAGEMVLNQQQQRNLFRQLSTNQVTQSQVGDLDAMVNKLASAINNIQIKLYADDKAIAESTNRGYSNGVPLAMR